MTDNEIIEGLKNCIYQWGCRDCEFYKNHDCRGDVIKSVLDLINRQEEKIERLRKDSKRLKKVQMQLDDLCKMHHIIKAEAYKECIDKVWKMAVCMHPCSDELKILGSDLDNLLKELEGENDEQTKKND